MDLIETEHVCSAASKRVRYRQEVSVGSETTYAVPFIIIPMKEGKHNIEVHAVVRGDHGLSDGIRKILLVVVRETHPCRAWYTILKQFLCCDALTLNLHNAVKSLLETCL